MTLEDIHLCMDLPEAPIERVLSVTQGCDCQFSVNRIVTGRREQN